MEICGFIFDLDGVITDTAEYHYRAWQRLADEEGITFSRAENEHLRGISRRDSLMFMLKGRPYPEARIQEMLERKNRYYQEYIQQISSADLLPGVVALLDEICASGLKSALGSASKNAPEVIERLGIRHLFDVIADCSSVTRQKPEPDLFLFAAKELGLAPSRCVVVEDAAAGIAAAQRGGFLSVGLGPQERVGTADVFFPSLEGVALDDILRALGAQQPATSPCA